MSPAYSTSEQFERWHKPICARCGRFGCFAASLLLLYAQPVSRIVCPNAPPETGTRRRPQQAGPPVIQRACADRLTVDSAVASGAADDPGGSAWCGIDFTAEFSALAGVLASALGRRALVLDGEIVALVLLPHVAGASSLGSGPSYAHALLRGGAGCAVGVPPSSVAHYPEAEYDRAGFEGGGSMPTGSEDNSSQSTETESFNAARLYDHFHGGYKNLGFDRTLPAAAQIVGNVALEGRRFAQRAVDFMLTEGVRQFLDLSSSIPGIGRFHESARRFDRDARVAYVNFEPVAAAHGRLLLEGEEGVEVVDVEPTRPLSVVTATDAFLNFSEPVGLIAIDTFSEMSNTQDVARIISTYGQLLGGGGFIALTNWATGSGSSKVISDLKIGKMGPGTLCPRTKREIALMLTDFDLVRPGIVFAPQWRSVDVTDDEDASEAIYAAVARIVKTVDDDSRGELICFIDASGRRTYPAYQFSGDDTAYRAVLRVNAILHAQHDPRGVDGWWNSVNSWLDAKPIDLINSGRDSELEEAAGAVGRE